MRAAPAPKPAAPCVSHHCCTHHPLGCRNQTFLALHSHAVQMVQKHAAHSHAAHARVAAAPPPPPYHRVPRLENPAEWAPLIDVGLPRTGTMSFTLATSLLGMRVRHGVPASEFCRGLGGLRSQPECGTPSLQKLMLPAHAGAAAYEDFDAISDTPMHLLDVAAMRAAFPRARFVCTSRTSHEWIASVTEHAKRYHKIGENDRVNTVSIVGDVLTHAIQLELASKPLLRHWTRDVKPALERLWSWHNRTVCSARGVQRIELHAPDAQKWAVLCGRVAPQFAPSCWELADTCWPTSNPGASDWSRRGDTCPLNCTTWARNHAGRDGSGRRLEANFKHCPASLGHVVSRR
jgi:hypothetical protein